MKYLGAVSKMKEWSSLTNSRQFNIIVIQAYAPTLKLKKVMLKTYKTLQS